MSTATDGNCKANHLLCEHCVIVMHVSCCIIAKFRQAEHNNYRKRTACAHGNRNPLFMVNMASGMYDDKRRRRGHSVDGVV